MLCAVCPPLLAITEADYPMLLWAVAIALMALGPALKGWVDVVRWFKGDALDASKLATKEELAAVEAEGRSELAAIEKRLRTQQKLDLDGVTKQITAVAASVGELRTDLRKDLSEMFGEIRSLHRSLGRAEGNLAAAPRCKT